MPPPTAARPAAPVVERALGALKRALVNANLAARGDVRAPLRRLTRLEYAYTIQDLLLVDEEIGASLGDVLAAEADSGVFDTVAANQSMSPLHVRAYLEAADRALDAAIALGPRPPTTRRTIEYANSQPLAFIANGQVLGAGIVKRVDDAYVAFFDAGSTYMFHTESEGFAVPYPGRYRATVEAYPYQADSPVTLTVYRGQGPGPIVSLDELLGSFDLVGDAPGVFELEVFLRPGEVLSPSVADSRTPRRVRS